MSDHTHKKIIAPLIIVALLALGGGFYGGMVYGKGKSTLIRGQFMNANGGAPRMLGQSGNRAQFAEGGATMGEIIAKDDKSITIKMRDGGSKIVFFSDSTQVMKAVAGAAADLSIGEQVTALGSPNADGSVSAQSIQIRPATLQNPEKNAASEQNK